MKVLIGTPIHQVKDYSLEQWLENVAKLQSVYPADVLLVDNSPTQTYVKKVVAYCNNASIKNYQVKHIDLPPEQEKFERIARSREVIREQVIAGSYDAWFSWECDQIIAPNALQELIHLMESGPYMMVNHNCLMRGTKDGWCADFGVSLISHSCLEQFSFLLEFGSDPEMPQTWEPSEAWFKKRVLRSGGNSLEIDGLIRPIIHLE